MGQNMTGKCNAGNVNESNISSSEAADKAVHLYLAHTTQGISLRALARDTGLHPSTVLRRVRRVEDAREDPLLDEVLSDCASEEDAKGNMDKTENLTSDNLADFGPLAALPSKEEYRILRRLCENGAFMAIAGDLKKGAVLRGSGKAEPTRTAIVKRDTAKLLVLRDWITCAKKGKVNVYRVTEAGRTALRQHIQGDAHKAAGFAEAGQGFDHSLSPEAGDPPSKANRNRVNLRESPLTILGRKKERNGKPFLSNDLVQAGERLREDFELAQIGPRASLDWQEFLEEALDASDQIATLATSDKPEKRLKAAFAALGPGLGDISLRCCCFLEGMEAAEKRMGWSARSGKIVLRIALQRLRIHYEDVGGMMRKIG